MIKTYNMKGTEHKVKAAQWVTTIESLHEMMTLIEGSNAFEGSYSEKDDKIVNLKLIHRISDTKREDVPDKTWIVNDNKNFLLYTPAEFYLLYEEVSD